ncbi:MAG: carboxyltransferase domain-containing protein [Acidobacteriota bacterium]
MQQKIVPAGDRALLIELGAVSAAGLHAAAAAARSHPEVVACIVGQRSLYVLFRGEPDENLFLGGAGEMAPRPARRRTIEVSFRDEYGPDLAPFLSHTGITRSEFFSRLASVTLTARYLGFRGGFAYLDGWPEEWAMPRRPTSRPVARGSFALAGSVAGFYPIDSPGGWNVLGRTAESLEHAIRPGDQFTITASERKLDLPAVPRVRAIEIAGTAINGPLATVVGAMDETRLEEGRPSGGPYDARASSLANRLVGNGDDAPVVECAMVGPHVRFTSPRLVAWCGADCDLPQGRAFLAAEVTAGRIRGGLRGYLSVVSEDPAFRIRDTAPDAGSLALEAAQHASSIGSSDRRRIRVLQGPHASPIGSIECEVTSQLDRVGIRLRPVSELRFSPPADLPSCGMQFGTVQLHPDGSLVAMGPDHPVTGGYLQPLTVLSSERWKLGHLTPGERMWFVAEP